MISLKVAARRSSTRTLFKKERDESPAERTGSPPAERVPIPAEQVPIPVEEDTQPQAEATKCDDEVESTRQIATTLT